MGILSSKYVLSDPATYATAVKSDVADDKQSSAKPYDYVIIGGGTAGCVLASRLSENPGVTVLLIEAGKGHGELLTRMPLAFPKIFRTSADWNYETTPQTAVNDRRIYWPRGKVLGGSSSINAVIYHHCDPEDFDEWVKDGAEGWTYENMKKYFQKAEKYSPNPLFPKVDASLRGNTGPWSTSNPTVAPICEQALEACKKFGIPESPDFNTSEGTMGVGPFFGFIDGKHQRSSAATAYLTPDVLKRANLTVAVNAMAEKIILTKGEDGVLQASGVKISTTRNGPWYCVSANREVIVCAGAVATPQLLMLSGIGPDKELEKHSIPVNHSLSYVGKDLQDHFSIGSLTFRAKPGKTWDNIRSPFGGLVALTKWLTSGNSPLASLAAQVAAFVRSDDESLPFDLPNGRTPIVNRSSGPRSPDMEIFFAPFIALNNGFTEPPPGAIGITAGSVALKPASKGSVSLRSSNVWDYPLVDANYLADENDLTVLVKATRLILRIARTAPLSEWLDLKKDSKDQSDVFWPGDANPDTVSDDDLKAWIRRNGQSAWHPTSSARMGSSSSNSVVDTELRVHGMRGLRVVDASVFPTMVSGHPCAVVVAVAERAADLIKAA